MRAQKAKQLAEAEAAARQEAESKRRHEVLLLCIIFLTGLVSYDGVTRCIVAACLSLVGCRSALTGEHGFP